MLAVEKIAKIRELGRAGFSVREIAEQTGCSSKTVVKFLADAEQKYTLNEPRAAPVFGPARALVDAILAADETAPRKQRHTAKQIHRRLVAEHQYCGGYDQVRRYVQAKRSEKRETFVPLDHPPGSRCECDFGHIDVDFPNGRRKVPVLIVTWSYSNAPFAMALPTERTEAILHGMCAAFSFFGVVPKEVWWDNPKTVVGTVLVGRERVMHERYAALAAHFNFAPKFCLPARGQEKSRVENRVYDLERQWSTPVPSVKEVDELNVHLLRCCLAARERTCGTNQETVGQRFERERGAALPIPTRPFDACIMTTACSDKYQTVAFDHNRYSVPRRFAFRTVTVKGYIDRVVITADAQEIATHSRCYDRNQRIQNTLHFLGLLRTKPATLDHAPVFRDWVLPTEITRLRREFEQRFGPRDGVRQYIRVLQLLEHHPESRLEEAARQCRVLGTVTVTAITTRVEWLACATTANLAATPRLDVVVPRPDLRRFDDLLSLPSKGDLSDGSAREPVTQNEFETIETADHARRA